ncbi:cystatin-like [Dendropsophus ebraccatus]|uniref:cystatin-like n=1 Tax=Dendropsophus ebraccatus TaxID=150705 RepID=UPI0038310059
MARLGIAVVLLVCCSALTQAGRLLGGRQAVNSESPEVKDALAFAMYELNKASNDMYAARPMTVTNAEKQIVSGINYFFDLDVARTHCRKPTTDVSSCRFHTDPALVKVSKCHLQVYYVPWTSERRLVKSECV